MLKQSWIQSDWLDEFDEEHDCKLEVAFQKGNLKMVLVLLENGCATLKWGWYNMLECQTQDRMYIHKWTPLTLAVIQEGIPPKLRLEIVNFVLEFNQDLDTPDESYRTAAHWATIRGYPEILQALLFKGANVHKVDDKSETLMGYAIKKWTNTPAISIDLVKVLLKNNFDVNTTNKGGNTPLHLAVLASSKKIVGILLRYNANKRQENDHGHRPIDIARISGTPKMISLLKMSPQSSS